MAGRSRAASAAASVAAQRGDQRDFSIEFPDLRVIRLDVCGGASIYTQGQSAGAVLYLERGAVQITVVSSAGKAAVIGVLEPGSFFGEGCLAGQRRRMASATAMVRSTIVAISKPDMMRRIRQRPEFAARVLHHILARHIRVEEDLIDQLFNSSEKRLARALVLLSHHGQQDSARPAIPMVSQTVLAEMIGSTRSRVNFFMNKFRRLGFIEYDAELKVNDSLLSVVVGKG